MDISDTFYQPHISQLNRYFAKLLDKPLVVAPAFAVDWGTADQLCGLSGPDQHGPVHGGEVCSGLSAVRARHD